MASVVISDKSLIPSKIKSRSYPVAKINDISKIAILADIKSFATSLKEKNYPELDIIPNERTSITTEILPFRVRFTNIGLLGESAGIPGIGLQIIGINNYIL
jgi:hypothetical protein